MTQIQFPQREKLVVSGVHSSSSRMYLESVRSTPMIYRVLGGDAVYTSRKQHSLEGDAVQDAWRLNEMELCGMLHVTESWSHT